MGTHMQRTSRFDAWRVGIAVLTVGMLAACGGGGDSKADPTTTTTDGTNALEARLLSAEDLATDDALDAGWEEGDVSEGVDIKLPDCVQEEPGDGATTSAEIKLVTISDLHLPSLEEDLSAFEDGGAEEAFAAAVARLDACDPAFEYQGAPAAGHIERLPLTLGGDQSMAWRTTVTIAGAPVAITNIHLQQGNLELALTHVDIGTPDPAEMESIAAAALAKLGA